MRNYNPTAKAWSWSYSKLKNYRTCPRRYYDIDVQKLYGEETSEALDYGNKVHKAWEDRISKGVPFTPEFAAFEEAAQRLLKVPGKIMVEQQLAIREDLVACTWFDKKTWYRSKADYLAINGPVALAIDYKTGKILEDAEQLALMAECVFSHYPEVQAVRTEYWWLADDAATKEIFYRNKRHETWARILPKVNELKAAHDTTTFPPKPNGLCRKHCIVTGCPNYGKDSR